jgi:ABC-type dipeptide/oligopeptide/nickel transport system ATPase component
MLPRNIAAYSGKTYLEDDELMALDDEEFRRQVRWVRMSLVPQAAMNSLNPVLKVGDQVAEPLIEHLGSSKEDALNSRTMFGRMSGDCFIPVRF